MFQESCFLNFNFKKAYTHEKAANNSCTYLDCLSLQGYRELPKDQIVYGVKYDNNNNPKQDLTKSETMVFLLQ